MSVKRLARLRVNWFMVGSVFGIAVSFFMNFLVTSVVIPGYEHLTARTNADVAVNETDKSGSAPVAVATNDIIPADVAADLPPVTEPLADVAAAKPRIAYPLTLALKLGRGETLVDMLVANNVPREDAVKVVSALKPTFNTQNLKAGQKISVTLARHETIGDGAAVSELQFRLPNLDTIALERMDSGSFNVAAKKEVLTAASHRAVGKVRSSLSQAANEAGIPNAMMAEILKAYSYDIDFQREIHPGDTIEVLMEKKTAQDGAIGGFSSPRYAVLTLQGKKHQIFRFKTTTGDYAWFDEKGNSVKKSLLRTPLNVAHITSGFGMRNHPILGYSRMHKGVDFGGAIGTPIMAAGDGIVSFKGWKNGYGNFVTIKHNNTYETAYGHMSKFGNISEGNRVKQGQVIGYVGMTGMASGPHLHYEVRANDVQVNPVAKQFNFNNGLSGKQLTAFNASKTNALKEMAALGGAPVKVAAATPAEPKKAKAKPARLSSKSQKIASR